MPLASAHPLKTGLPDSLPGITDSPHSLNDLVPLGRFWHKPTNAIMFIWRQLMLWPTTHHSRLHRVSWVIELHVLKPSPKSNGLVVQASASPCMGLAVACGQRHLGLRSPGIGLCTG